MKNTIRIQQTIKDVNGKCTKIRTVWDLGQQKLIGEPQQGEALDEEKTIGEYDMRLDKETFNYFKNQERLAQQYKDKNKMFKKRDSTEVLQEKQSQSLKELFKEQFQKLWNQIKSFAKEFNSRMRDKNYIFMVS